MEPHAGNGDRLFSQIILFTPRRQTMMNRILNLLRSLEWRALFAVPVLSVLFGVANNLRVSEDRRVVWSGEHQMITAEGETVQEKEAQSGTIHVEANVERGVWTTDFVAATNAAETAHLPVVVVALLSGCPYCVRLHQALQSEKVKTWQKDLGWYFVMTSSAEAPSALNFVKTTPVRNKRPPYAGVYWRRADGECVMRNFSAKSGHMGVETESSLALEWMHAVEASVPGAPGVTFIPKQGLGVHVSVKAESERFGLGRVKMSPQVEVIPPGQKVVITAKPSKGGVFAGWRYPDGRVVNGGPRLTLDSKCQAGEYKAIFRRRRGNENGGVLKTNGEEK